jgi:hypothetical protein
MANTRNLVVTSSDACHVCHPLAGLGINIGFGDVIALKNTIDNAIYSGADIGTLSWKYVEICICFLFCFSYCFFFWISFVINIFFDLILRRYSVATPVRSGPKDDELGGDHWH